MGRQYIDAVLFSRLIEAWPRALGPRLPSQCAVCRGWGSMRACSACIARFAVPKPRCERCAIEVPSGTHTCGRCLTEPPPFARCVAALDYVYPWDRLIQQYKFADQLDLARPLIERMHAAWHDAGDPTPGVLLPLPLADTRLRERGHNQAWGLARRLARTLDTSADPHLLLRVKDTPHQLSLPREQRVANVRGAFAVEPLRLKSVRGQSFTLVDDVMTTGATASAAAGVLLQAGAASVNLWVAARTPRPADTRRP